jgi:hypothetical protein
MKKYVKKPVEIDAMQLTESNHLDIIEWGEEHGAHMRISNDEKAVEIKTLEGTMRADIGDYVIKGIKGEFYPCKPDIFNDCYDVVS